MPAPTDIAIVVPARGFPGAALLALRDALLRHGRPPTLLSSQAGAIDGDGGVTGTARAVGDCVPDRFAALIVLDGPDETLADDAGVRRLLQEISDEGRVVCGVGHGVAALAAAGLVGGLEVAAEGELADRLGRKAGAIALREAVVTAPGVVTALERGAPRVVEELIGYRAVTSAPLMPGA